MNDDEEIQRQLRALGETLQNMADGPIRSGSTPRHSPLPVPPTASKWPRRVGVLAAVACLAVAVGGLVWLTPGHDRAVIPLDTASSSDIRACEGVVDIGEPPPDDCGETDTVGTAPATSDVSSGAGITAPDTDAVSDRVTTSSSVPVEADILDFDSCDDRRFKVDTNVTEMKPDETIRADLVRATDGTRMLVVHQGSRIIGGCGTSGHLQTSHDLTE